MRHQCCQPTFGSPQCFDCPLTAPLYRPAPLTQERVREIAMRWAGSNFRVGVHEIEQAINQALSESSPGMVSVRVLDEADPFCPKCGHNRDTSSVSTIDNEDGTRTCQMCGTDWREAMLAASERSGG